MAAERKMTFGVIVGNRGFFPDHLAKTGREEIISVLEAAGARAIVLGSGAIKIRRGGNVHRSAALRRALQEARRRDRRHHLDAAQLRRRARHRGCDSPVRPEGAGAGAGYARPLRSHDHRYAPRQLLRQDVAHATT